MDTISILGCGWLGFPLAEELLKHHYKVKGSTTSPEKFDILQKKGIQPCRIRLNPAFEGETVFLDSEVLIINIPPKAKTLGEEYHLQQIKNLLDECRKPSSLKKIIFVSSTSVYPNIEKEMIESDADSEHFLVKAENLISDFCEIHNKAFVIIRFGGLMGYERNPCKYFTEKTAGDGSRVNYIHRDDAVGAIMSLLHAKISNETINIVCPEHPSRAEIWAKCKVHNDTQSRNSREVSKKIIRADRFLEKTKYQFLFPDPLAFKYL
ncbi:MAG TPA: hypothetical protein VK175_09335 [Leadbetterella sp.]|nr:hypothetical protein [Leadbetterella sp.]